ncbi:MAG TPA: hypothetical protein VKP30_02970, partial [Polyangiaceae bacterium]|nr:hypothetical protein [Polyangiaceae bacterium]
MSLSAGRMPVSFLLTSYRYLSALLSCHPSATWIVMVLLLGGIPSVAHAQSDADRATARNLAAEGHTALRTQDCVTAEDRFRRADALVHAPTLVVEHARALICLGRFVEAQERLGLVMREGVSENAPWVWKKALQDAEKLVDEVKPKVGWLTINVSGPRDPVVLVDGVQVPVVALGVRRATDPGERTISASAQGFVPKEVTVTMPEGGDRAVTIDLVAAPHTETIPAGKQENQRENPLLRSNPPKKPSNAMAYVAFGLGGAGLVAGTISGIMSLGKRSDLQEKYGCTRSAGCTRVDQQTLPEAQATLDDYRRYGLISGIGFGVGLA